MVRTSFILLSFFLISLGASGQYRYMVYFADKAGTPFSTSNPIEYLSQRAIDRRAAQGIVVVEQDLPVISAYVDGVASLPGVDVLYASKWFNGLLVQCDKALVSDLQALPYVTKVQYAASNPLQGGRIRSSKQRLPISWVQSATDNQLSMLGIDKMHTDGFHGEGMLIAVMDSGFPGVDEMIALKHLFDDGRVDLATSYNFAYNLDNVFGYDPQSHGTKVLSVMAAYDPGNYIGGAYKSDYVLFVTEDINSEFRVEEFNWLFAAERADSAGVDVINTSLGYNLFTEDSLDYAASEMDGETAIITRAASIAASKGIVVVAAAGNEDGTGWPTVTAPADGKNLLAVGGVTSAFSKTSQSSTGPTADGRIKPDVMALGQFVAIVLPDGTLGTASGTSVSAPLITSLVAGIWQALPELTAQEIMDTIRSTASLHNTPNNSLGYGIPNYNNVFAITDVPESPKRFQHPFPNPARHIATFSCSPTCEVKSISAITPTGSWVGLSYVRSFQNQIEVDISAIPPGAYIIQVNTDEGMIPYKLVKIE